MSVNFTLGAGPPKIVGRREGSFRAKPIHGRPARDTAKLLAYLLRNSLFYQLELLCTSVQSHRNYNHRFISESLFALITGRVICVLCLLKLIDELSVDGFRLLVAWDVRRAGVYQWVLVEGRMLVGVVGYHGKPVLCQYKFGQCLF